MAAFPRSEALNAQLISGGSTEKALPHELDRVRRSATVVADPESRHCHSIVVTAASFDGRATSGVM
jgi:hypothetical protein